MFGSHSLSIDDLFDDDKEESVSVLAPNHRDIPHSARVLSSPDLSATDTLVAPQSKFNRYSAPTPPIAHTPSSPSLKELRIQYEEAKGRRDFETLVTLKKDIETLTGTAENSDNFLLMHENLKARDEELLEEKRKDVDPVEEEKFPLECSQPSTKRIRPPQPPPRKKAPEPRKIPEEKHKAPAVETTETKLNAILEKYEVGVRGFRKSYEDKIKPLERQIEDAKRVYLQQQEGKQLTALVAFSTLLGNDDFKPEEFEQVEHEIKNLGPYGEMIQKILTEFCWDPETGSFGGSMDQTTARNMRMAFHRECIIDEIIASEKEYLRRMGLLISFFLKPLKNRMDSLDVTEEQIENVFHNVEAIHSFHQMLLEDFETREIIEIFLSAKMNYLKMYEQFTTAFNIKAFSDLTEKNSKCKQFLADVTKQNKELANFERLIIVPVTRLGKYELFLRDLLKNTPKECALFKKTEQCLEKMRGINKRQNEAKRRIEHHMTFSEIERSIRGIISPQREIIYDTSSGQPLTCLAETANPAERQKPVRVVLMTDMIIWSFIQPSPSYINNSTWIIENCRKLKDVHVRLNPDLVSFHLVHDNFPPVSFLCVSPEEAKYWGRLLQKQGVREPEWKTLDRTVLWVDDFPENNVEMIDSINRKSATYILSTMTSTEEATDFLTGEGLELLERDINKFRIVCDLERYESKTQDNEPFLHPTRKKTSEATGTRHLVTCAGALFIKKLREVGYNEKIMLYTSDEKSAWKQLKQFDCRNSVWVCTKPEGVVDFCSFKQR